MSVNVVLYKYKVPRKQAGNGPEAPTSSIKKLFGAIKGWDSPKFSTENDSGPAIPSPINKETSSNSDQRNPRVRYYIFISSHLRKPIKYIKV